MISKRVITKLILLQPVGNKAQFGFVTNPTESTLIITLGYSTKYVIERYGLDDKGVHSPPLSHKSDIAFLEWKRACTKYGVNTRGLKHVFLSVILTEETQKAVKDVLERKGKAIEGFDELPDWREAECLTLDTVYGKAMLGTIQLQGIAWMLLQHREHLGRKTIKQICIFKDTNTEDAGRGPSV